MKIGTVMKYRKKITPTIVKKTQTGTQINNRCALYDIIQKNNMLSESIQNQKPSD